MRWCVNGRRGRRGTRAAAGCRSPVARRPLKSRPPRFLPSLSLTHTLTHTLHPSVLLQLAARIAVSNLHKNTLKCFSET